MDFGAAALSFGGDVVSGLFSARQAAMNRDFQQEMADHAFQRRAADLQQAGLNPILAATQGPAGVGGGAMATGPSGVGSGAVSSALAAERQDQLLKHESREAMLSADRMFSLAREADFSASEAAQRYNAGIRHGVFDAEASSARAVADAARTESDVDRRTHEIGGVGLRTAERLAHPVSSAASAARSFSYGSGGGGRGLR